MSIPSGDINAISDDLCFGSFPSYGATADKFLEPSYTAPDWKVDPANKRKCSDASLYALELAPLLHHSAPPTPPEFAAAQSKKPRLHSPSPEDCIARLLNIDDAGRSADLSGNVMLLHSPCDYQNLNYRQSPAPIPAADAKRPHDDPLASSAMAKKQERMIKNRAAAVLSRQRKKEHMQHLEQHIGALSAENKSLKSRITELEDKLKAAEKERDSALLQIGEWLRRSTNWSVSDIDANKDDFGGSHKSKATGVVLMLLFFSFAIFSNTLMYISDGGSRSIGRWFLEHKESEPSSSSSALRIEASTESNGNNTAVATTRQSVHKPNTSMHDLHRWLQSNGVLDKEPAVAAETRRDLTVPPERGLILLPESAQFQTIPEPSPRAKRRDVCGPRLSLLSPVERHGKYLRIDVQVLGSQHVK